MWRVVIWCLSVLSMGLRYIPRPNYDVFNNFACFDLEKSY